ncbi:MAG: hypothetical protein HN411_01290 [Waddliaceae bacterium]|nr:hypothetical protein [Waddliaceae bacterium]
MKKLLILLIFPVLLYSEQSWHVDNGEGFSVSATLTPEVVEVGDTISVSLAATFPVGYNVDIERLRNAVVRDAVKPYEFIGEDVQEGNDGDMNVKEVVYTLDAVREGSFSVRFFDIVFVSDGDDDVVVYGDVFYCDIQQPKVFDGVVDDSISLLPVQDSPAVVLSENWNKSFSRGGNGFNIGKYISWIIAAVVFCGGIFSYRSIRRRCKVRTIVEENPRTKALSALDVIEGELMPSKGLFEEYYVAVTDVVRKYIEEIYGLKAPMATTEEFLDDIVGHHAFTPAVQEALKGFLFHTDLVKFAGASSSTEESALLLFSAREFVSGI